MDVKMPNVTFNKNAFTKAIGKKFPDQVLAEKMALIGTDVNEITEAAVSVEVFPNRTDMLGLQGFARSMRAFLGLQPGLRKYSVLKGKGVVNVNANLRGVRPFTACAIVRKLKLDPDKIKQIIDLQEKLHGTYGRKRKKVAMGIYPLNKVEMPISFEARSPSDIVFTPLDMDKPQPAMQILKDHPKGKDYAHLLFGLREFPIFVDNTGAVMSLVPIVNSQITGRVTEQTKEVFVEVSGFDFDVCHKALLIVCAELAEMGGQLESVELRYGAKKIRTPDFTPAKMTITAAKVNKLLGTNLTPKDVTTALKKMGHDVTGANVLVPAYRTDIMHEVDLIEEVAIGYGYNNLQPTLPNISTVGKESRQATIERKIRELFIGMGFIEVRNFCLSSPKIQVENTNQTRRLVEMENPLTADYSVLRYLLIPGLLETLARNQHNEYPQVLFEIGPTWNSDEEPHVAFVICAEKNAGFTEAKSVLEALMRGLGKQIPLKPYEEKLFISGRAAVFPGGFFGEIHPSVLTNFGIPFAVAAGEIRFREILE
jgi:phenylalanyl-tRNA synthetase beta chain